MDAQASRSVALLSIHPSYVEAILSGEKRVEFRRSGFPMQVKTVVVYCTTPVQRVVGYFSVEQIVAASPAKLWRDFQGEAGIDRSAFFRYYAGCRVGKALRIEKVIKLSRPLTLKELGKRLTPPQNVRYLDQQAVDRLSRQAA